MAKKQVKTNNITPINEASVRQGADILLKALRELIDNARGRIAQQINTELVMLNWHIGNQIRKEILLDERAEYGKAVIDSLANKLTMEYGRGYTRAALFRMVQFAELFPDQQIVAALGRQLSWTSSVFASNISLSKNLMQKIELICQKFVYIHSP